MQNTAGVVLLSLFACASVAHAQTSNILHGIVTDTVGTPIPFAQISVNGTAVKAVSGSDGAFSVTLGGAHQAVLSVRRLGFSPTSLDVSRQPDSTVLRIALKQLPQNIAGTVSTATVTTSALVKAGFYERMVDRSKGLNNGTFIGPEEIEARHPSSVLNLLNGAAPSVSLMGKKVMGQGGACQMDVYVNRHRVDAADSQVGTHSLGADQLSFRKIGERKLQERSMHEPSPIEETAPASEVIGVEIYPRAVMAPPEFQRLAGSCGVVVIWTK